MWSLLLDKQSLDLASKVWSIKGKKKGKLDFIKIKNYCSAKYPVRV